MKLLSSKCKLGLFKHQTLISKLIDRLLTISQIMTSSHKTATIKIREAGQLFIT